jgi:hypothetical protein
MRGTLVLASSLLAGLLAAGCFEGKADFTFNPDGSGKVVGDITFPLDVPWVPAKKTAADELKTPDEQMKDVASQILKRSTGIETWKDVSFERVGDDHVRFKGTAYFKDATKVKIFPDVRPRVGFGPDADAMMLILTRSADREEDKTLKRRALSTEEMSKALKEERLTYAKVRGTYAMQLTGMKMGLTFDLPGMPGELHGLAEQDGRLATAVDGQRILLALDALVADNAYLRELILSGGALSTKLLSDEVKMRLFSPKGEAWAKVVAPLRVRFDYKAEVDAAKKAYPEMMVKLGLDAPKPVRPPVTPPTRPATPPKTSDTPKKGADGSLPKGLPKMPANPLSIPAPILPF